MGMVIRTNMMALNSNNALNKANSTIAGSMEKLSTGFRINKAADDASGLSISEKMKAQIKALDTAVDNCEDGANMIQTAEGYMAETQDMLNRMVELAEKSANGVLDDTDRDALQDEMNQLCAEIDRIATTANFNGKKLMDGSLGTNTEVQITSVEGEPVGYNDGALVIEAGAGAVEGDVYTYTVADDGTEAWKDANGNEVTLADKNMALGEGLTPVHGDTITVTKAGADASGTVGDPDYVPATAAEATYTSQNGITLQIGESSTAADRLNVSINNFHTDKLLGGVDEFVNKSNDDDNDDATAEAATIGNAGVSTYDSAISIDITDKDKASAAADALRQVSNFVSDERGRMGALQNRLEHTVNNLTTASENTSAANSRIRDTDMAKEMIKYTSTNVITQAAQAMLAQANTQPQNVLQLLQ